MAEQAPRNIVGPQIRQLRFERNLTQNFLAARCGVIGLDISRGTLSKIEAGLRCVTDQELFYLALALRIPLERLYPAPLRKRLKR